jgi:hypothetical protein
MDVWGQHIQASSSAGWLGLLSRNVRKQLPTYGAEHTQTTTASILTCSGWGITTTYVKLVTNIWLFLIIIQPTYFFSISYYTATCFGLSGHHQAYKYKRKMFRVKASPFYIEVGYLPCMDRKIFQIYVNDKIIKCRRTVSIFLCTGII